MPKLKLIAKRVEDRLKREGVKSVEVTFYRRDGFSVLTDSMEELTKAKAVLAKVDNVRFESEDVLATDDCGYVAYYRF